jgi:ubiquinol-cytochrome c reductase cytochrome c1 subunit
MIKRQNILAAVLTGVLFATTGAPVLAQTAPAVTAAAPASNDAGTPASAPGTGANASAPSAGAPGGSAGNGAGAVPAKSDAALAAAYGGGAAASAGTVVIPTSDVETQPWSFAGIFGRYDQNQLQRGFEVFRQVCSNCHSAHLFAFRNLEEEGGPAYSVDQVKALAATYTIDDPTAPKGKRPGLPSDYWPSPFPSEQAARDANGGALPPDWSVLAKARGAERAFPLWVFDYFTTYQEGGPDYVHALMNGYLDKPPAGFTLAAGKYYNKYFPGHAIGMPPPLSDGIVKYKPGADGTTVPETVDQYSRDAAAFMMWLAEPGLDGRKEAGFRVIIFLLLFAVIMWMVKRRIWANVEH